MGTSAFSRPFSQSTIFSLAAVLIICSCIVWKMLSAGMPNLTTWDLFGSHVYLPMVFDKHQLVYHDITWMDSMREQYDLSPSLYQVTQWENGNFITRNTCGWALLMLPFYLIAEGWASMAGYPTDGFSYPYQFMLVCGAIFYSLAGFLFLRKVLLHFFTDRISAGVILLLGFGTNLLFTQYASAGSTNNIEFSLVAAMLFFTIRFHGNPTTVNATWLALSLALIGLVRPPDLVVGLIPLFWNSTEFGGLIGKVRFYIKNHKAQLLAGAAVLVFLASLQPAYWKITTGRLLINSYNNHGEGFDWFDPHLKEFLFSFRKGWLLYTPLMIFALSGLVIWFRKSPSSGRPAAIAAALFIYVASTWTNWWYAASFSQRSLIDIYPILAIGLGFFLSMKVKAPVRIIFATLIGLFVVLNLFQTWQIGNGILHVSQVSRKYYLSIFGQTTAPAPDQTALLLPEENTSRVWSDADDKEYKLFFRKEFPVGKAAEIKEGVDFGPVADISQEQLRYMDNIWVKAIWTYEGSADGLKGKIFTWNAMHGTKSYGWRGAAAGDPVTIVDTNAHTVTNTYFVSHLRSRKDILSTSIWNQDQKNPPLRIRSLRIEGYMLRDPGKYE